MVLSAWRYLGVGPTGTVKWTQEVASGGVVNMSSSEGLARLAHVVNAQESGRPLSSTSVPLSVSPPARLDATRPSRLLSLPVVLAGAILPPPLLRVLLDVTAFSSCPADTAGQEASVVVLDIIYIYIYKYVFLWAAGRIAPESSRAFHEHDLQYLEKMELVRAENFQFPLDLHHRRPR